MKKYIVGVTIIIIGIFCLNLFNKRSKEYGNYTNLSKISIGMPYDSVINIMGNADHSKKITDNSFYIMYNSTYGSSENYIIYFTLPDSNVNSIVDGR